MKPDLDFDKTIAEELGYSDFCVSGLTGLLWGRKDGHQDPIAEFHCDFDAAWSLFDGEQIEIKLSTHPDGRVAASFFDQVGFSAIGDNPAHAVSLAWWSRELRRSAKKTIDDGD